MKVLNGDKNLKLIREISEIIINNEVSLDELFFVFLQFMSLETNRTYEEGFTDICNKTEDFVINLIEEYKVDLKVIIKCFATVFMFFYILNVFDEIELKDPTVIKKLNGSNIIHFPIE